MRRRLLAGALVAALALTPASGTAHARSADPGAALDDPAWPAPPEVRAAAYVLVDAATGQVLAAREPDVRRPVASTVKMLTALTVLRHATLDETVVVGDEVAGVGGAGVGLEPGDRWTVAQLLDGLVARSGNDAAVALAVHVGGSVRGFVEAMRREAVGLGLRDVVLSTPNGLDDANRLSARDLGVIARALLADPRGRSIAGHATVELPGLGTVATRNELLGSYPGATGIKTGYTQVSGWSVVGSARRGDRELIAVVLGSAMSGSRFTEAAALLDHGFEAFRTVTVPVGTRLRIPGAWVSMRPRQPPAALVPVERADVTVVAELPVEAGGSGTVALVWRGHELARAALEPRASDGGAGARGNAAVGRWLSGRAYAALRAGLRAGALRDGPGRGP